jgi:hypothetical protein
MSYDIGGGYDGWRTATPWDDEVVLHVEFECSECEEYNENVEVVVGSGSEDVDVECVCGHTNNVGLGE